MINDINIEIPKTFQPLFKPMRFKVMHGGRGSGKSYSVGLALLIKAMESRFRFLCTREIQKSIKDSVHKLLSDQIEKYNMQDFKITDSNIFHTITGSEFIFKGLYRNIHEIKSMEGIDIVWCEEAQNISRESLEILIPTIRREKSEIWFTFNRFLENDPVYDKFGKSKREDVWINYSTYRDNPFFPNVLRTEMEHEKEADYDNYLHVWEGEPLYQSEDSLLDRNEVKKAMNRTVTDEGQVEVGVDVARYGSDRTTMYKRKGLKTIDFKEYSKLGIETGTGLVEVSNRIKQFAPNKTTVIKVDATGVGGGVSDILRNDGFEAIDINFGSSPKNKDKYDMLISEMWFEFKSILPYISIPNDPELFDELVNRKKRLDKRGRWCVESKDQYKKRGFKSPDKADGLILSYYQVDNYGRFVKNINNRSRTKPFERPTEKRIKITQY